MKHSGNKSNINKYDKILMFLQIIDIIFVIVQISIFKNVPLYINIIMTVISIPLALLIIVYTIVSYIKSKKLYVNINGEQCEILGRIGMFHVCANITGKVVKINDEV